MHTNAHSTTGVKYVHNYVCMYSEGKKCMESKKKRELHIYAIIYPEILIKTLCTPQY